MVLARFLPRDQQFFSHFADAAENAVATARLLAETIECGPDMERNVRRLRDLEHQGDEITHRIYQALNSTFVTPLDRDDIQALASGIDDFVDDLEEAGKRLWLYRIGEPTEPARLFVRILVEQAETVAKGIPHLEKVGNGAAELKRCILQLHQLENEADDALNAVLATLYDCATDIPSLIKSLRWGELYGLLEDATDRGESIGNTLEGILLKNA
jgi:predicted phosphate transport protein (TIGR00153 family)